MSLRKIYFFWIPLAATWLMMSVEGPFLAALIARLAEPKYNLAAYGVAFSFALIIEAPIIMIMSASTALVRDRDSYLKLRNFTAALNLLITLVMLVLVIPTVFYWITRDLMALPAEVARLTHLACLILIPWPGVIGIRRFQQGILIRDHLTRRVAYGTVIRLTTMALTALIFYLFLAVPGVVLGAAALSVGVCAEMLASRLMVHRSIKKLLTGPGIEAPPGEPLTYHFIFRFYYPLALTSIIALGSHPIVTFFMGQSRLAIESLAVLPVINSLVFIFRSMGLSYQEVAINFISEGQENYRLLKKFAVLLGIAVVAILSLISFTSLSNLWFHSLTGLSRQLSEFAKLPTRILAIIPGLTVWLSFQRAMLVNARRTAPITWATAMEVGGIILILFITIWHLDLIGAVAASLALVLGRLIANGFLFVFCSNMELSPKSHHL